MIPCRGANGRFKIGEVGQAARAAHASSFVEGCGDGGAAQIQERGPPGVIERYLRARLP